MILKQILQNFKINAKKFLLPGEENEYRAGIFSGNFLIYLIIAVAILKIGFALFIWSFSGNPFYADITKTALVALANEERAKNNLPALVQNPILEKAAHMKAMDMVEGGYFNHISPSGINPWYWFNKAGYNYKYAGENLAVGFLESDEVQNAWLASPTHKANIDNNKYQEIGIAVLKANFQGNPATLVVQLFGTKQPGKVQTLAANRGHTDAVNAGNNPLLTQNKPDKKTEIENKNVLGASTASPENKKPLGLEVAIFFAEKYFNITQILIYGALTFVTFLLLLNFWIKPDVGHADLLAKAVGFVAIMAIFALLDKNLITALIPHNFFIQ